MTTGRPAPAAAGRLTRRACLLAATAGFGALLQGCAAPEPSHSAAPIEGEALPGLHAGDPPRVAGEPLDGALLRRFYARRGFRPVWADRPAQAAALANAVLQAGSHGLDPELFHASLLRRAATFPPTHRELLLSHAVLSYAEALAHGAVPAARREERQSLAPEPVDVAAVLDRALEGPDAVAEIESLAPRTQAYAALREALRRPPARARPDQAAAARRLVLANLERQRWLPRQLPPERVWVDITAQRLTLYREDRPVVATRVVVGRETDRTQSPELHTLIEGAFFNPPWVIPADIVAAQIMPRIVRDPEFLARANIVLHPNGEAEQAPGPLAGLGVVMFDMPNRFDVFLHDTPDKGAFARENRRISNGCIRVENPLALAALLMERPLAEIEARVAEGRTVRDELPRPVPVFLVYHTLVPGPDGSLSARPDFYGRDEGLWRALHKHPPEPPAAPEAGRGASLRR
ncbi:MAG: L,D-transpeptidase family protein [Acetobacteraceae bacterium]|nr:L,D-transpeptidase family protein [Acetobacteraceae bacterium]